MSLFEVSRMYPVFTHPEPQKPDFFLHSQEIHAYKLCYDSNTFSDRCIVCVLQWLLLQKLANRVYVLAMRILSWSKSSDVSLSGESSDSEVSENENNIVNIERGIPGGRLQ
ncbi:hypothetical protein FQA39_LY12203 [Lamprigera yunnana]|nr:hypothetical protein FQA39_LY12203 [Lamprigera yunnana]